MVALGDLLDDELVSLMQGGNQQAFAEIYNRYKGQLVVHAYKKLGNFEDARDIVQEAFSAFWNKRGELNISLSLAGFLYTMVSNRVLNFIKHQHVVSRYASSFHQMLREHPNPSEIRLREKDMEALIQKEIDNLPPKMRIVFLLSRKENLSHKEIAESLHISEATVKNHIKAALKILRMRLGLAVYCLMLLKF
ncbi:RNA polymerase sigma-70 factor [Chitinophaga agrisoli]|uniref:RNA polymerase sigma-70 factor n=1 Tax=Chitinophaga agrisoli TaxID=2607653 RepID=A0A5B2W1L0_9BACT|nr:RNA polymerase sigma-70 factor [Chitinophaga agrisoli]KAA2245215.1 RNA polymerase sigma-70 factor [Chitinophaga agrisoli]